MEQTKQANYLRCRTRKSKLSNNNNIPIPTSLESRHGYRLSRIIRRENCCIFHMKILHIHFSVQSMGPPFLPLPFLPRNPLIVGAMSPPPPQLNTAQPQTFWVRSWTKHTDKTVTSFGGWLDDLSLPDWIFTHLNYVAYQAAHISFCVLDENWFASNCNSAGYGCLRMLVFLLGNWILIGN
jgi:hypothetical protein